MLALEAGASVNHALYFVRPTGSLVATVHVPTGQPLERYAALLRSSAHDLWLVGVQLRVMRGVVELDLTDHAYDPEAVPGSSRDYQLQRIEYAADVLDEHVYVEGDPGWWCCSCGEDGRGTPRQQRYHVAEVLDEAQILTGPRW